jgi:hypothetical protein
LAVEPRKYKEYEFPELKYTKRAELMTNHSREFFHDVLRDGRRKLDPTPYCLDMNKYRQMGIDLSVAERLEIDALMEEMENERLKAHHRAVRDSYKYDRIQADKLFNRFQPALRIIPLTDRRSRPREDAVILL